MNQLTTIAALPGSGAGCMSSLPPEKADPPKVQMRAAYFEEALKLPEIDQEAIPPGAITMEDMEELGRNLERMRAGEIPGIGPSPAAKHGFEPFDYSERN